MALTKPTQFSTQSILNELYDDTGKALATSATVTAKHNTTPPTYTNGQTATLQTDANGNLKTTDATLHAGEDLTANRLMVEQRNSYATISTAATTTVKSGSGFVHTISIVGGTLGALTVYDNTAGSGTPILPTFTPTATLPCPSIILDVTFSTGLTIVTAAATIMTVSYR